MILKPLVVYRVTKGNTNGCISKNEIVWMSKDGSLNIANRDGDSGFLTSDELTSEIMDFEAVLCNVYKLVKIGNDEHLIMRKQTPEERESVQNYIKSISECVVPYKYVEMIYGILDDLNECPCDIPSIEDYMFENNREWCQNMDCGRDYKKCWERYFELKWKEQQNDIK
ncbi:MAG: hypothetical protein IKN54_04345 [Lachnospiraceae bacterium]|nr:hypothetical protein [Lachnospiraceae bacterium]